MTAPLARGAAALLLTAGFGAGLAWLSSRPLGAEPRHAAVRLALRTALGNLEVCRERTADELAALPAHMRQGRVCEDRRPDYRLELAVDGEPVLATRVRPPGIHRDRPLTVDELVPVAPGRRRLAVRFAPDLAAAPAAGPTPPAWRLDCATGLVAGRVLLVLLDGAELTVAGGACDTAATPETGRPPAAPSSSNAAPPGRAATPDARIAGTSVMPAPRNPLTTSTMATAVPTSGRW